MPTSKPDPCKHGVMPDVCVWCRIDERDAEITRLRASLAEAESTIGEQTDRIAELERAAVWAANAECSLVWSNAGDRIEWRGDDGNPEFHGYDGTDADLIRAALEAMGGE